MILSFAEIQAASAGMAKTKDVELAELGGAVRIHRLSADDCVTLGSSFSKGVDVATRRRAMHEAVAKAAIDQEGTLLFADAAAVESLDLPFGIVAQLFAEVATISGLFADEVVEGGAKNS